MYTQIIPATDWFFVHDGPRPNGPPTVWRLAAWGLDTDGKVVGLVGAFGREAGRGVTAKLVSIPPVPGDYRHVNELSEVERSAAGVPINKEVAAAAYHTHVTGNVANLANGSSGVLQATHG